MEKTLSIAKEHLIACDRTIAALEAENAALREELGRIKAAPINMKSVSAEQMLEHFELKGVDSGLVEIMCWIDEQPDGYWYGLSDAQRSVVEAANEVTALREELAKAKQDAVINGWQPIETAPKDGRSLLLGRFNALGKWRTMRGEWVSQSIIDQEWEDPDGFEEGWYETAVEADIPNCWSVRPTHWMVLPKAPAAMKVAV